MKPISFLYIWEEAFTLFKSTKKEAIKLILATAFLPLLLVFIMLYYQSQTTITYMRQIVQSMVSGQIDKNFYHILNPVSGFVWYYGFLAIVCGYMIMAFYLALIHLIANQNPEDPITAKKAFLYGLRLTTPRGFFLLILLFLLSFEQIFLGALRPFSSLAAMAPVLYVLEEKKIFLSLKKALILKYLPSKFLTVNGILILLTMGLLTMAADSFLSLSINYLAELDDLLQVSRTLWVNDFLFFPFSLFFLLSMVMSAFGYSLLLAFLAYFTTTYYLLSTRPLIR